MKKTIYMLALTALPLLSFGQKKGFYLAPNLSGGILANSNDFPSPITVKSPGYYFSGSATLGYLFTNHIGLFTGIGGEELAYTLTADYTIPGNAKGDLTHDYLYIPVYFRFVSGKADHVNFYLNAGFKVSFLTSAKEKDYTNNILDGETDIKEYSKSTIFSPYLSAGARIPFSDRLSLDAGPEWQTNVNSLYKSGLTFTAIPISLHIGLNVRVTK